MRKRGRQSTAAILIALVSWGILALGKTAVIPLIIGIATLDLGLQGLHISNQHAIYALAPEARSRLTTAYMVAYFLGSAVCSALSSAVYDDDGWDGVCVLGAAIAATALAVWAVTEVTRRHTAQADDRESRHTPGPATR